MAIEPGAPATAPGGDVEEGAGVASPRADLLFGIFWLVFGLALFYGGWSMDRLENLGINPYTAPGLLPTILGAIIAAAGGLLTLRAIRAGGLRVGRTAGEGAFNGRVLLGLVLYLGFALGLLGRGLPFMVATFIFLLLHMALFGAMDRPERPRWRTLLISAAIAAPAAFAITTIFQEFFLVRLP